MARKHLLLIALVWAAIVAPFAGAQTRTVATNQNALIQMPSMAAAGSSTWYDITAYGATDHILTYSVSGTPTALPVALECSRDGGTTSFRIGSSAALAGDTIRGSAICTHVRFTIDSITGTARVFPIWIGLTEAAEADSDLLAAFGNLRSALSSKPLNPTSVTLTGPGLFGKSAAFDGYGLKVSPPPSRNPCADRVLADAAISQTASTKVVSGLPGMLTVICGVRVVAGAAEITSEWEGSGTTCGTGTLAHSGSTTAANGESFAANGGYSSIGLPYSLLPGNDWCLAQSTSSRVSGKVWYTRIAVP